jgi:ABC-type lipoprotein release transport system permease subunit
MPIDLKMAWRNVWRHPRRSILTMAAIGFACVLLVFMMSWQFGSYDTMINFAVKIRTGHLQVQARGYNANMDMRMVVPDPAEVGRILNGIDGVTGYTFRGKGFSMVSSEDRTYGALVVGIDPEREATVSTLEDLVREGRYLAGSDTHGALVGTLLAQNLRVDLGDELVLLGQGRDGSIAATVVQVRGIFSSGQDEFDRSAVHIPLRTFQEVYSMRGAVHEVVVQASSLEEMPAIKKKLAGAVAEINHSSLVALDWKELMPGLVEGIKMDLVSGLIFYFILIVVVAFSITNTFLMAVFERTREFGVLMAIGTTPGRLTGILLLESTIMTVLGIAAGIVLGCLVTWYFQVHGIVISGASEIMSKFGLPNRTFPALSALSVTVGPAVVLIITLLTALYPALKVQRLRPVKAMTAV